MDVKKAANLMYADLLARIYDISKDNSGSSSIWNAAQISSNLEEPGSRA
jgi:hypothetical protein